jgi:hypothetical protein
MKKTCFKFLALGITAAVLALSCKTAPKEEPPAQIMTVSLVKVNGSYPAVVGQDELNALIENRVKELFSDFEAEVDKTIEEARLAGDTTYADGKEFTFDISYTTGREDVQFCSFLLDFQWNSGGAHGEQLLESVLWDTQAKKQLTLRDAMRIADIPSLEKLSADARAELEKTLNPSGRDAELSQMIKSGTEPIEDNFKVFLLENMSITFYFQRYQTAPGAAGVQKVTFPLKRSLLI